MALTTRQALAKRTFDLAVAAGGLVVTLPVLALGLLVATVDSREWGVFSQSRIGRNGAPFRVYKLRTMRTTNELSTVTRADDARITRTGRILRRTKIDELPQLINVIRGEMSLVGPRPDVAGWADVLTGPDREILSVRPGITCPASVAFRDEEELLSTVADAEAYNRTTIWPEKVRLNLAYVREWSFRNDISCLIATVLPERTH